MEGYEVVTSDDHKLGHIAEIRGSTLIIEHGHVKKTRHAVPDTFAYADDSEKTVRLSVSKDLVCNSPKVNGDPDEQAIAEHYGLAAGVTAPETEGYGELVDEDPARTAEQDTMRAGIETPEQQRARIREGSGDELGESPGLLGDRLKR
jgi:hypothetical protein